MVTKYFLAIVYTQFTKKYTELENISNRMASEIVCFVRLYVPTYYITIFFNILEICIMISLISPKWPTRSTSIDHS